MIKRVEIVLSEPMATLTAEAPNYRAFWFDTCSTWFPIGIMAICVRSVTGGLNVDVGSGARQVGFQQQLV